MVEVHHNMMHQSKHCCCGCCPQSWSPASVVVSVMCNGILDPSPSWSHPLLHVPKRLGLKYSKPGSCGSLSLDPSCSLTVSPALLSLGRLAKLLQNDLWSQEGPAVSQDDTNSWWIVMHKVPKISASYPSALHKYVFTLTFMIAVLKCCQTTVLIFGKWTYDSKASLLQQWK